jgi:hypothetical protein
VITVDDGPVGVAEPVPVPIGVGVGVAEAGVVGVRRGAVVGGWVGGVDTGVGTAEVRGGMTTPTVGLAGAVGGRTHMYSASAPQKITASTTVEVRRRPSRRVTGWPPSVPSCRHPRRAR